MLQLLPLFPIIASLVSAQNVLAFDQVQQPDIDYSSFNDNLAVLGSFDSISFYDYIGQSNESATDSETNHLYVINAKSQFKTLHQYDGVISSIEKLTLDSVLLLGDFQILDNYSLPVILNTSSNLFTAIDGWADDVSGEVMSVFYDSDDDLIYFGGDLSYKDEVYGLVIYDLSLHQFKDSPFRGFNEDSTVNSIVKIDDNDAGSIIFGGSFDSLGDANLLVHRYANSTVKHHVSNGSNGTNTTISVDPENVVSLKYAVISSVNTDSSSDAASLIICPENGATWRLNGQSVGSWTASLPFQVYPSKLRLYNSVTPDTGVEYFRVITSPTNGIMNLTYVDPESLDTKFCDAWCPLLALSSLSNYTKHLDSSFYSINSTLTTGTLGFNAHYQEFEFINSVEVSSVTVQVMSGYNALAALSGVQLFQSGIVTYANDSLNEPNCGSVSDAEAQLQGGLDWATFEDVDGTYLTTTVASSDLNTGTKYGVTFYPNVEYSGQYSVLLYTPGCNYDNKCASRGIVNATLVNGNGDEVVSKRIYQNNQQQKYDVLYTGHLDVEDGVPYVEMWLEEAISATDEVVLVADRVELQLLSVDQDYYFNSTNETSYSNHSELLHIPINGLFEYSLANFSSFDNSIANISTNGSTNIFVGNSSINLLGSQLSEDASVNGLAVIDNVLYVAGDFESQYGDNFFGVVLANYNETSNSTGVEKEQVLDGGVDGYVSEMFVYNGDSLILVGDFQKTANTSTVSKLNSTLASNSIHDLAFYNGSWYSFDNGTSATITTFTNLTFHGTEYFVFNGDNGTLQVWDNTHEYWVSNSPLNVSLAVVINDNFTLAAGKMSYMTLELKGAARISDPTLSPMPFEVASATHGFYASLHLNDSASVFGGQFNTSAGVQNLVFVDFSDNSTYGIDDIAWDSNSKVTKLLVADDKLFIGMQNGALVHGKHINGLIIYELANTTLSAASVQPASLSSDAGAVQVNALVLSADKLYVGGNFQTAGSLPCQSLCSYDLQELRWTNPLDSGSISAGVVHQMTYYSATKILLSGNLTLGDDTLTFAIYDTDKRSIVLDDQLDSGLTSVIKSFILVDEKTITKDVIGMGDQFLGYYNGSQWVNITDDLDLTRTTFTDIQLVDLKKQNSDNDGSIFGKKQVLMVSGNICHDTYGNFTSGFYNGTAWIPYLFSEAGSSTSTVLQDKSLSLSSAGYSLKAGVMKVRNVVGVSFACALGSLLLVVLGYCLYQYSGLSKPYNRPMELRVAEKDMLETVPPTELINSLDHAKYMAG